jgi:O-antigen/teichoic acid export membrane protein
MKRDAVDALLLTAGRIAFVGLWFLAVLLVYRSLGAGPEGLAEAGLFALAIASVKVVSGCLSDPVDLAVMGRIPPLLRAGDPRAFEMLRAAFGLRLGATLGIAGIVALAAPFVAQTILARPEAAGLVRIVAAAMLGDIAFRSVLVVLQASERFRSFLLLEALMQIGRFAAILLLWANDFMRVDMVLACYAAVPFAVALAGLPLLPRTLLQSISFQRRDVIDFLHYLKWMMPAMMLAAVNERLDIFLVYSFTGAEAAGLYGALLTLAVTPDIVAGCFSTILQPRIVGLHASGQFAESVRRFLTFSIPLCGLAFLVSLVVAEPIIALVLGERYVPAVPAFHWLLAGMLFWLAVTPLPMTLVAILAPRRIVLVTLGQTIIVVVGGLVLLPWFGLVGMAQAVFTTRVVIGLALVVAARKMTRATPAGTKQLPAAVRP